VDWFLFRAEEPVADFDLEKIETAPHFGPRETIKTRLIDARIFGASIEESHWKPTRGAWCSEVNEFVLGKSFETLHISADSGRTIVVSLWGDPVEHLTIEKGDPKDFLPIVDALADLGPFVVASDSEWVLRDIEELRPGPPTVVEPAIDGRLSREMVPESDGLRLRWAFNLSSYGPRRPVEIIGGRVVVADGERVTVLDVESGDPLWCRRWRGCDTITASTAEVIIVAGDHPEVFGVRSSDGEVLWSHAIQGRVTARPCILSGGELVVIGTEAGHVYGLDCRSGEVAWWIDWVPNAVYTRPAASGERCVFTSHDWHCGIVYCLQPGSEDPVTVHSIDGKEVGRSHPFPSMIEIEAVGDHVFLLLPWAVVRLDLPRLESAVTVREYHGNSGFERFLSRLDDRRIAYAISTGEDQGAVEVIDAATLEVEYEIPLRHTPSEPAILDQKRWACLLRPFRSDRESEGRIEIFSTQTGESLESLPLGFRGWQGAHVAASEGRLVACYLPHGPDATPRDHRAILACWEAVSPSPQSRAGEQRCR
jgi:outer membrane protein assembly factor BamB